MNDRVFFVLNQNGNSEIILRAFLSNDELFNEIKSIFSLINFNYSSSISKIFTSKYDDGLYLLEMQITVLNSEKKSILNFIRDANYVGIS